MSKADTLPTGVEEAPSNTAVTQVYEPGSVFKLVTFSAALAAGVTTPNQAITVPSALPMGTYTFHDAESHGSERLTAAAFWPSRPTSAPSKWPRRWARTAC